MTFSVIKNYATNNYGMGDKLPVQRQVVQSVLQF
jgi:hypothetical protein